MATRFLITRCSLIIAGVLPALLAPDAAIAQAEQITAEEALREARRVYGPPAPNPACPESETIDGQIVVCGETPQDDSQYRVQSSSELNPTGEEATKDPVPRAPNVDGPGIFQGPATVSGGCFLNRCPAPPAYIVDFSKLPEPPAGSEAAKMAGDPASEE